MTVRAFSARWTQRKQQNTFRAASFFMAVLLIAAASFLSGCGGGGGDTTTDAQQPAVSPAAGTVTITWIAPATNEDGTPISALAGYKVHYGTTQGVYTSINVGAVSSYQVSGLNSGEVYYFAVSAYDSNGNESDLSEVVSKVIG